MGKMTSRRPEHQAPPEIFYNEDEATKYTQNTRIIEVQTACAVRALELLCLPPDQPCLLLDLGCGSGLSGEVLTEAGHHWVGADISEAMLDVAVEREVEGGLLLHDLGAPLPFRPASFDGAVSVSALQWLCNRDHAAHNPAKRLAALFNSLFECLNKGARAVFQFYPENEAQLEMILAAATRAGFGGGVVVDYPNSSKAKKYYLVVMCGGASSQLPAALGGEQETAGFSRRDRSKYNRNRGGNVVERIRHTKNKLQKKGRKVHRDTKYTGRPRSSRF